MSEEEEETKFTQGLNSKVNDEYGKQLCEATRKIM